MTDVVKKMLISTANKDYLRAVERRKRDERELDEEMRRKMEEDDANNRTDESYDQYGVKGDNSGSD